MTKSITSNKKSLNFLTNTRASFEIHAAPDISFNCNSFAVPSITTSSPTLSTPFTSIPIRGDTLVYEPLFITFLVAEDLSNWELALNWLKGITAPESGDQFKNKNLEYSDATVYIYSSHNNLTVEIEFTGLTPIMLGGLRFETTAEGVQEIIADMSFDYQNYKVKRITKNKQ